MKKIITFFLIITIVFALNGHEWAGADGIDSEMSSPFVCREYGGAFVVTGYKGECDADFVIPEEIDGKTVIAIGEGAFAGRDELEKVTIPETVIAIGEYAFESCKNLREVYMPGGEEAEFNHTTFYNCSALTGIDVGDSRITGFTDNTGVLMGSYDSREEAALPEMTTHPFKLFLPVKNCLSFTLNITVKQYAGDPFGTWIVYAREGDGAWESIAEFELHEEMAGERETFTFVFEEAVSFDSLALVGKNGVQHGTSFSTSFRDAICRFSIDGK